MRRLSRLLSAALAAGVIALLGLGPANAAIVTTISDGIPADTVTLVSAGNTLTGTYTIDGYSGNIEVVNTNFPGTAAQGTLTTTTTINLVTTLAALPLTIHSGVYTDITAATLASFTLPNSVLYNLKNDVTGNGSPMDTAMIVGTSKSNGVTSPPGIVTTMITGTTKSFTPTSSSNTPFLGMPGVPGPNTHTLENTSVISGIVAGDSALSLAVASTVTAVAPEPSTLGAALIALPVIGFVISRRKRSARV